MIYVKTVTKEGNGIAFKLEKLEHLLEGFTKDKQKRYDKWMDSEVSEQCPDYGFKVGHIGFNSVGELTNVQLSETRSGGLFE